MDIRQQKKIGETNKSMKTYPVFSKPWRNQTYKSRRNKKKKKAAYLFTLNLSYLLLIKTWKYEESSRTCEVLGVSDKAGRIWSSYGCLSYYKGSRITLAEKWINTSDRTWGKRSKKERKFTENSWAGLGSCINLIGKSKYHEAYVEAQQNWKWRFIDCNCIVKEYEQKGIKNRYLPPNVNLRMCQRTNWESSLRHQQIMESFTDPHNYCEWLILKSLRGASLWSKNST